jgi:hypothetical protein
MRKQNIISVHNVQSSRLISTNNDYNTKNYNFARSLLGVKLGFSS